MFICKLDQQRKNWRITRKLIVSKAAVPSECCYTTMQLLPLRYKNHLCSQTERLLFSLRCRLHKSCRFVFCHSAGHFPRQHILVGAKKLHFLDSKIQAQMNWYFNNDAKLSPLLKIQLKGALLVFLLYTLPLSSPLSCMMPCEPGQVGHSCTSISMIQGGFFDSHFLTKKPPCIKEECTTYYHRINWRKVRMSAHVTFVKNSVLAIALLGNLSRGYVAARWAQLEPKNMFSWSQYYVRSKDLKVREDLLYYLRSLRLPQS